MPGFVEDPTAFKKIPERVPSDKVQWKPHPKSFALGHLTQLVARIVGPGNRVA